MRVEEPLRCHIRLLGIWGSLVMLGLRMAHELKHLGAWVMLSSVVDVPDILGASSSVTSAGAVPNPTKSHAPISARA